MDYHRSFYICTSSDDSVKYYDHNTPSSFTFIFPQVMDLDDGRWFVCLQSINAFNMPNSHPLENGFNITSKMVDTTFCGGQSVPLLKRIFVSSPDINQTFTKTFGTSEYRKIIEGKYPSFTLNIRTLLNKDTSFYTGTLYVTLHFLHI